MADQPTVRLPGVGPVPRRTVIVGAGVVAAIVLVAYMLRSRRGAQAPAVDPATGSLQPGGDSYTNPAPSRTFDPTVGDEPNAIFTDGEWSAAVQQALQNLWEPQFMAVALGKYLDGQGLTSDEAALVRSAWATEYGRPPSNRPIVMAASGQSPGDTTPPPPPPPPPPAQLPTTAAVSAGANVYDLTNAVWGVNSGWGEMERLNPGIRNDIYWDPNSPDPNNKIARWRRDRTVKIR